MCPLALLYLRANGGSIEIVTKSFCVVLFPGPYSQRSLGLGGAILERGVWLVSVNAVFAPHAFFAFVG